MEDRRTLNHRRCRLFKEADKLSELCDARISIFVVAETGKCFNYTSSDISTKDLIDQYQRSLGIDIWRQSYERMEEDLKKLEETNMSLRRQIGQRTRGENLNDLSFEELIALERETEKHLDTVRRRKHIKIQILLDVAREKLRRLESLYTDVITGHFGGMDDPINGIVENGGIYEYRVHRIDAPIQLPNQPNQEDQTESCLTSDSSVSHHNSDDKGESVRTPCSSPNLPDFATSEDIPI